MRTRLSCLTTLAGLLLAGCGEKPSPPPSAPAPTNAALRSFEARGVVRSVPETGRTLVVRHEEIPGYMPKMTMELNVRDTNELRGLQRDDEIAFRLTATADTHWIENIRRVGHVTPADAAPVTPKPAVAELKPGDALPDAGMIAEDGRPLRFSDFRGKAVAFTFFFTRCPLPDFCPRLGANFAKARGLLLARTNAPSNWQFISISFDPEFDQPEVLTAYSRGYRRADQDRWLYAAATPELLAALAPRLDFMFAREGGGFAHNLRTVVLDPQGRVFRLFDGNQWTPEQLADALAEAAGDRAAKPKTNAPPGLHNVFRLTPHVLSGSQPEGAAAFAWIAEQGVKTIVSVDGARPDVEAARQHGLRYVHLPVGYDGVPTNRIAELAQMAATLPGPFYVHCHHGKHRGPAAAAVLCEASAHWSAAEAEAFLKQAGTAPDYPGLYRSVREFRPPAARELAALTNALPEVAATPGLVQAMVALDGCMERLRACQQADWHAPANHPDLSPANESLQLWEQLRELGRSGTPQSKPLAFRELLETSERSAGELRRALQEVHPGSGSHPMLDARLRTVTESCSACHVRYRN